MQNTSDGGLAFLDARRPIPYEKSVDILNTCFGEGILGKYYYGWQKGAVEFQFGGSKYTVWFPKLSIDGTAATQAGWVNRISEDGTIIEEYGGTPYTGYFGERLVFAKAGKEPYIFRGVFAQNEVRSKPDHHIYEKVADIADFSGDIPAIHYFTDENEQDSDLLKLLKDSEFPAEEAEFQFQGKILPVPPRRQIADRVFYPRNPQTAKNALSHAGYKCEWDPEHFTFIRRRSDVRYTEPHHLVPMSVQDRFQVSLDVEENIVSLCSTCHNHIHYGKGADQLISALYAQRKDFLKSAGIDIALEELLSFYH